MRRRLLIAALLVVVAIVWLVAEPIGKGRTVLAVTESHGIDAGDLPAMLLLAVAGAVVLVPRRRKT